MLVTKTTQRKTQITSLKVLSIITFVDISLYILLSMLIIGCTKEQDSYAQKSSDFSIQYPDYISMPISKKTLSEQKVTLGKQLFFDTNLSSDGTISCATCHKPELAFSDDTPLSPKGVPKTKLIRNSPPLFNLAWHTNFFWDSGATNLRSQAIAPLTAKNEMNGDIESIIDYLNENPSYKKHFNEIYNATPSTAYLLDALAEYEFSITSFNTKYDQVKIGKSQFTQIEENGYQLYLSNCSTCHTEGLFSDYLYHNNGLDTLLNYIGIEDETRGRNRISFLNEDLQKYKTPSLRNTGLTAPYMHDGRFSTLSEVLNHYSHNVKNSTTLSNTIPKVGFQFTYNEKKAIISFLNTLNDTESFK